MRVMVIVKATKNSEAGVLPGDKLLTEMGRFNEELVKAGIMLAGDGLHPSSKGCWSGLPDPTGKQTIPRRATVTIPVLFAGDGAS